MAKPITFTLSYDLLDEIVADHLKDTYISLMQSIRDLKGEETLEQYRIQDLIDHMQYAVALKHTLSYFMVKQDFDNFIKSLDSDPQNMV